MTSDASKHVEAFTIDLPPSPGGESFAQYRANSASVCAIDLPSGADPSAFWFRSTLFQLPNAVLFKASAAAHRMRRGPAEITQSADQIMLALQLEGEVVGDFGGHRRTIGPGDVHLTDQAHPYDSHASDFVIISLIAACDRFHECLPPKSHGAVLPAAGGSARLLGRTLQALFETAGSLTVVEATAAVDGLCDMAAGLFAAALASPSSRTVDDFERALAIIDGRLADPDLTPAAIERELDLSRSRLYRLFAPHGGVGAFVLGRRLDQGARLLLNGTHGRVTVRALAARCGFRSEDHFGRAFRDRFGVPPRAFRDMVQRRDVEALRKQAQIGGFDSLDAWIRDFSTAQDP